MQFLRKNISTLLLVVLLCVLLLVPNAKAFFLKGLLHTGLFNASTKKGSQHTTTASIASLLFADKNGNRINVANLKGKVIFINFWATWCPPCIAEMGSINTLYNKLKNNPNIVFIAADADNNLVGSAAFMDKHQYNLPVYQLAGSIAPDLYSGTLPTTLIIDASGNLVQKHEGIANWDTDNMIQFLKSLE